MQVRNAHTAQIEGLVPGAVGELDENRSGVQVLLRAGLLVEVIVPELRSVEVTGSVSSPDEDEPGEPSEPGEPQEPDSEPPSELPASKRGRARREG